MSLGSVSILRVVLPVVIPVVNAMNINPIYFAVVVILSIEAGLLTPPVGLNVFTAKAVAESGINSLSCYTLY
ncbi:TRAP transporter large permease subunit [Chloroflexota bacterium]